MLTSVPDGAVLPAGSQAGAYRALLARDWFARLVPEASAGTGAALAALRADQTRRDRVNRCLAAEGPALDGWA